MSKLPKMASITFHNYTLNTGSGDGESPKRERSRSDAVSSTTEPEGSPAMTLTQSSVWTGSPGNNKLEKA